MEKSKSSNVTFFLVFGILVIVATFIGYAITVYLPDRRKAEQKRYLDRVIQDFKIFLNTPEGTGWKQSIQQAARTNAGPSPLTDTPKGISYDQQVVRAFLYHIIDDPGAYQNWMGNFPADYTYLMEYRLKYGGGF